MDNWFAKPLLLAVLFFSFSGIAQVVLSEVMYDSRGPERSDEFIEIYNAGAEAVDLSGWRIGDGRSSDGIISPDSLPLRLAPGQFAVILDADYFGDPSTTYDSLISPEALLLTVDGSTLGSAGLSNSTAETIQLFNTGGDTVQQYTYSPGNSPGYSDEKIDLNGGNDPENWGDSRVLQGTPGFRNSLTPAEIDLRLSPLRLQGNGWLVGEGIPFEVWVQNIGRQTVSSFYWATFKDANENGRIEGGEMIAEFLSQEELVSGDSLRLSGAFPTPRYGEEILGVALLLGGDQDSTNNISTREVFVDDPGRVKPVINEIMFEPQAGFAEWVEIYNQGSSEINLRRVLFADTRDTLALSDEDFWLMPGGYVVVGKDSVIITQYGISETVVLIRTGFPGLNNDFDDLRLLGPSRATYDRVRYTSDWYGRDVEPGTSLEKLHPAFDGQIPDHWAASVAPSSSTPGGENSVFLNAPPARHRLDIQPNPFSPDGDGFEDFTAIRYQLDVPTAFASVRIFDIRGRLIRFLLNGAPIAGQGQVIWDGKDDHGRTAAIGPYICLFQALNPAKQLSREMKKTVILVKK